MSVIIFLIVLTALVFVHEMGHFLVAKRAGIRVDEFGLGFPPRLWSFRRGETTYSLNLVPFGGFVKIFGENPDDQARFGPDAGRSFINKNRGVQAAVLVAGVAANIVFAWLLISVGFMSGLPSSVGEISGAPVENPALVIINVLSDSPAALAGLKPGFIMSALSAPGEKVQNPTVEEAQKFIASHGSKEILVHYRTPGSDSIEVKSVTPRGGIIPDKPAIGISMDMVGTVKLPAPKALFEGAKLTAGLTVAVTEGLYSFIYGALTGTADFSQVTGPVGIAKVAGEAKAFGLIYLLSFTAFISINLAVINLIPFPALDGGRLLFVGIEAIKRTPINPKVATALNSVGFALLIILMILVTYQDVVRLF
ncbi:MAG: site-2 protease family protein [Candidatus Taylorbacteria bacterium]|nr:site-2 protease family protein [Candidatus Taylorbacteria bacterium]